MPYAKFLQAYLFIIFTKMATNKIPEQILGCPLIDAQLSKHENRREGVQEVDLRKKGEVSKKGVTIGKKIDGKRGTKPKEFGYQMVSTMPFFIWKLYSIGVEVFLQLSRSFCL